MILFAGAADASAATVTVEQGALVFRAAPGEGNDLSVNDEGTQIVLSDQVQLDASPALCEPAMGLEHTVRCTQQLGGVWIELGDGNDRGRIGMDLEAGMPITVDGGDGDDELSGDHTAELLSGGAGNDTIKGGAGDDHLFGGAGNDTLQGGDGADEVRGEDDDDVVGGGGTAAYADTIDGGAGRDALEGYEYSGAPVGGPAMQVHITLGGGNDDGRPGERDDVTGIEIAKLLVAADITPAAGPVEFSVFRTDPIGSRLIGSALSDTLTGYDYDDVIEGGAGDDAIVGGYGNDSINPGPGRDTVNADAVGACNFLECRPPQGNDTIDARDGEVDSITCGVGQDRVLADPGDVVAADCEAVERQAPAQAGPAGGGTKGGASLAAAWPRRVTASAIRRGTKLAVTVPGPGRVSLSLLKGAGRTARPVAKGAATARSAKTFKVALRALKAERGRVRRGTFRLRISFKATGVKATSNTTTVKVS